MVRAYELSSDSFKCVGEAKSSAESEEGQRGGGDLRRRYRIV